MPKPDRATMMMRIGLMTSAATAAWPRISPPTMPRADPIWLDMRMPASLIMKKDSSRIRVSTSTGKGTRARDSAMEVSRSRGITWR